MSDNASESIAEQNRLVTDNINRSVISKIVDSISTSVVVLNQNLEIVYFNEPFDKLVSTDVTLGRKFGEVFQCVNESTAIGGCSTGKFCTACPFYKATANAEKTSFEGFLRSHSMDSFVVDVESQNIEIDQEKFCVLLVNDLSDKKRKNLLDRAFFHDLNNSITLVQGHLSMLNIDFADNKSIQKLEDIFKGFFEEITFQKHFLSIESDDLIVCLESFDLTEFTSLILESFKIKAATRNINLQFECANSEPISIQSDPTLLRRVIINMIKNAVEASVSGETVTLKVGKDDGEIVVSVSNPKYMDREIQAKVFSKFFSTKGAGRGLGTFCIKLFTEKYLNGTAKFYSTKKDGTRFEIAFSS